MLRAVRFFAVAITLVVAAVLFVTSGGSARAGDPITLPGSNSEGGRYDWYVWYGDVQSYESVEARYSLTVEPGGKFQARWECEGYYGPTDFFTVASHMDAHTFDVRKANSNGAGIFITPDRGRRCAYHIFTLPGSAGTFRVSNARVIAVRSDNPPGGGGDPLPTPTPSPSGWTPGPSATPAYPTPEVGTPEPEAIIWLCPLPDGLIGPPTPVESPEPGCIPYDSDGPAGTPYPSASPSPSPPPEYDFYCIEQAMGETPAANRICYDVEDPEGSGTSYPRPEAEFRLLQGHQYLIEWWTWAPADCNMGGWPNAWAPSLYVDDEGATLTDSDEKVGGCAPGHGSFNWTYSLPEPDGGSDAKLTCQVNAYSGKYGYEMACGIKVYDLTSPTPLPPTPSPTPAPSASGSPVPTDAWGNPRPTFAAPTAGMWGGSGSSPIEGDWEAMGGWGECEPTYPKVGMITLDPLLDATFPGSWNPLDYLPWIGHMLENVPRVVGNALKSVWNTAVDAVVPSDCLEDYVAGAWEDLQGRAPFVWIAEGAAAVATFTGSPGGADPDLCASVAGQEFCIPVEETIAAVPGWVRTMGGGLVWLLFAVWVVRFVSAQVGVKGRAE